MTLSESAEKIIAKRYLIEGEETSWSQLAKRVGNAIAEAETAPQRAQFGEQFAHLIDTLKFIPGGRILRNAGRLRGSLFNCYHLPIGDSIDEIGDCAANALKLWADGGGVGINFSSLRPEGNVIKGIGGQSSGLVSFMRAIDGLAACIESGGSRRAASLGSCDVSHPEVEAFINAKLLDGSVSYFNISVNITKSFLEAVLGEQAWPLMFRGQVHRTVDAKELWHKVISNMVQCGEPGILVWDNLIKNNSYYFAPISGTNPSLRAGTRVLTTCGIFPIEVLQDKDIYVFNLDRVMSPAHCVLSGRHKKLYKIKLEGGHSYFATAEHKWPVLKYDGFPHYGSRKVTTTELKPGDHLPRSNFRTNLPFGNEGTYEDGFVVGWNLGDGWQTERKAGLQIGFMASPEDMSFGIHTKISDHLKKTGWSGEFNKSEINVNHQPLRDLFTKFKVRNKREGLPESVWTTASESFRKGLVDGLFSSDGCVSDCVSINTAYKKLADDLSDLLGFYGLNVEYGYRKCKASFPNKKDYGKLYDRYTLRIRTASSIDHFKMTFALTHSRKQNQLKKLASLSKLIIPDRGIKVVEVVETELMEDVWDLCVDDDTHCFELSHCITGNCGEACLAPYDVCDLGSIVLPNFVDSGGRTKWGDLEQVVSLAVRFLDNVIDVNKYRLDANKRMAYNGRRIGLGVMGLAEYLFAKHLKYGSKEALSETSDLLKFIRDAAYRASVELSKEKGAFPAYDTVQYHKASFVRKLPTSIRRAITDNGIRNVTLLALAPTGTISLIPEVTGSIEPLFSKAYVRADRISTRTYVHPELMPSLLNGYDVPDYVVDANDLTPTDHLEMQATCQKFIDGAVSKTINVPNNFTAEDLSPILFEYLYDIKGVTVYRDGSRSGQVLTPITIDEARKYVNDETLVVNNPDVECAVCASGACEI